MNKRYYLVIIDILFMFVVILIIALMSISFEKQGDSNTSFNSVETLKKMDVIDKVNEYNYIALELYVDKISVSQVTPTKIIFINDFYDIKSFSSSSIYSKSINFVLFDDKESPFLGDLIRVLNMAGKKIYIAS